MKKTQIITIKIQGPGLVDSVPSTVPLPFSFPFSFVFHSIKFQGKGPNLIELKQRRRKGKGIRNKVDRVLANHSLSSTASQGTSNIPLSSHPSSNLTARHGCFFVLCLLFVLLLRLFVMEWSVKEWSTK